MRKSQRILLHLACMLRKSIQRKDWRWHWQHLIREFGLGEYCDRALRRKRYNLLETKICST